MSSGLDKSIGTTPETTYPAFSDVRVYLKYDLSSRFTRRGLVM